MTKDSFVVQMQTFSTKQGIMDLIKDRSYALCREGVLSGESNNEYRR